MQADEPTSTPWGCILAVGASLLAVTALICSGAGWMFGTSVQPEAPVEVVHSFDPGDDFVVLRVQSVHPDPSGVGMALELIADDGRVLPMLIGLLMSNSPRARSTYAM